MQSPGDWVILSRLQKREFTKSKSLVPAKKITSAVPNPDPGQQQRGLPVPPRLRVAVTKPRAGLPRVLPSTPKRAKAAPKSEKATGRSEPVGVPPGSARSVTTANSEVIDVSSGSSDEEEEEEDSDVEMMEEAEGA